MTDQALDLEQITDWEFATMFATYRAWHDYPPEPKLVRLGEWVDDGTPVAVLFGPPDTGRVTVVCRRNRDGSCTHWRYPPTPTEETP